MRTLTLRTIGIAGGVAVLLLSATVAFAQNDQVKPVKKTGDIFRTASTTRLENKKAALERIADIKDKAKQQVAQRLAGQFENINKKWTDHFMQLLDRHVAVLQKIQDRADIVSGNGKDITAVTSAIKSAQTAIESARTAVITQASRTYELDTSSITSAVATTTSNGQSELVKKLRTSFQNLHKALFKDLFALRDGSMTDVRKAMQNALQALKEISGADDKSATSTSSE